MTPVCQRQVQVCLAGIIPCGEQLILLCLEVIQYRFQIRVGSQVVRLAVGNRLQQAGIFGINRHKHSRRRSFSRPVHLFFNLLRQAEVIGIGLLPAGIVILECFLDA